VQVSVPERAENASWGSGTPRGECGLRGCSVLGRAEVGRRRVGLAIVSQAAGRYSLMSPAQVVVRRIGVASSIPERAEKSSLRFGKARGAC